MNVGENGSGYFLVEQGGAVDIMGDRASLVVANSHSLGTCNPLADPTSILKVESGGTITIDSREIVAGYGQVGYGARLTVGNQGIDDGQVIVDGAGSLIEIITNNPANNLNPDGVIDVPNDLTFPFPQISPFKGANAVIGDRGQGELTIQNGGAVTLDSYGYGLPRFSIAQEVDSLGDVTVTGTGSKLEVIDHSGLSNYGAEIEIGNDYNAMGTLTIENGASALVQAKTPGSSSRPCFLRTVPAVTPTPHCAALWR